MYIENSGLSISRDDIEKFEQKHRLKLPSDYFDFLLKFNGGSPYPNSFLAPSGVEVVISRIFSLYYHPLGDVDGACSDPKLKTALKKGFIQIADDLAGQAIFLAVKGTLIGSVIIEIDGAQYLIARSFSEFLQQAEKMVGVEVSSFHEEWLRLAEEKVSKGQAGIFEK